MLPDPEQCAALAPLAALLGLGSTPLHELSEEAVHAAYRKKLKERAADVGSLKQAALALASAESRAAYCASEAQARRAPMLALSVGVRPPRTANDTSGSKLPDVAIGRPAFGYAAAQGQRPSMEDELILGEMLGDDSASGAAVFAVLDGHGGPRAAKMLARQVRLEDSNSPAAGLKRI